MTPRHLPLRRLLPLALRMVLPMAAVLGVLVAMRQLSVVAAAAALALAVPLAMLTLRPMLADLAAVAAYLRALAAEPGAEPPAAKRSLLAEQMLGAIAQLRRAWRQKNAELQAMVAATEAMVDSLPDPLFFLDAQRRVVRANLAARRLFGQGLAGRELASALRDPGLLDATRRVVAGGVGEELDLTLPVPVARLYRVRVEPLPAAAEGAVAVLALHDVTALKRIERTRADFIANASHELRTPLSALLGFIETLRGPARDDAEARDRFLAIMHDQAMRMSRLVNDLLSLSRIESNEHSQPAGGVDLKRLLAQVADGLAPQAAARRTRIVLSVPDDLPLALGDADELAQVFQNLIDNAIKYGREGTPVEVTVRADGQRSVAVSVRDHGDGVAREHLPRLTERFYRVDTARSRSLGSTGLGLAIVKHVVNRHRGSLAIDSTVGEGSTFTVSLPVVAASA